MCTQPHATIKGLSFEDAQKGAPLTPAQRSAMEAGLRELEGQKVMGIAGDCGFLQSYQEDARKMSRVPTFISPLLQAPMLARMYAPHEYVLVITANGAALKPQLPKLLGQCTVRDPATQKRFLVAGCEDVIGFGEEIRAGKKIDIERVTPEMLKLVKRELAAIPTIRCILLECTELPPYADAIREATRLPVLDSITLVDFFHGVRRSRVDWPESARMPLSEQCMGWLACAAGVRGWHARLACVAGVCAPRSMRISLSIVCCRRLSLYTLSTVQSPRATAGYLRESLLWH